MISYILLRTDDDSLADDGYFGLYPSLDEAFMRVQEEIGDYEKTTGWFVEEYVDNVFVKFHKLPLQGSRFIPVVGHLTFDGSF
jgi:hypothetical protein